MKKYIIFLILLCAIFIGKGITVNAKETKFYEAEYIDGIWMNKSPSNDKNTIYYQKARLFREKGTNKFAYCIEPEAFFNESENYTSTEKPYNLNENQLKRIKALAFYGYNYQNHTDIKWYAITQLLIWKEADPNGIYYFTDSLNGNYINIFNNEINEIENLVENHFKEPSFKGQTIEIVNGKTAIIEDTNKVLNNYKNPWTGIIKDNKLIIETSSFNEGDHQFTLERKENLDNAPAIFFESNNSQNTIIPGSISNEKIGFNLKTIKTKLEINKIDSDNKNSLPYGEATLSGAIFEIFKNNESICKIEIDKDGYGKLEGLDFGKYYLKEIKAGKGYQLNSKIFEFEINKNNTNIELTIENQVIKKKIQIIKKYGKDSNFKPEENIIFNIYDCNEKLVETIKTNKEGYAEIVLPYGKYTIKQLTTTEGYKKVNPIIIEVNNNDEILLELKDYKIEVPNTRKNLNIIELLLEFIIKLIC